MAQPNNQGGHITPIGLEDRGKFLPFRQRQTDPFGDHINYPVLTATLAHTPDQLQDLAVTPDHPTLHHNISFSCPFRL